MGAFYSTLDDKNNIENVYYKGVNEKDEKYLKISQKYIKYLKDFGFYQVELDLKEWETFVNKNKEIIEYFQNDQKDLIESFISSNKVKNSGGGIFGGKPSTNKSSGGAFGGKLSTNKSSGGIFGGKPSTNKSSGGIIENKPNEVNSSPGIIENKPNEVNSSGRKSSNVVKKRKISKTQKSNMAIMMLLLTGSMTGIYLIDDKMSKNNDNKKNVEKINIVISKMFLNKKYYSEFIDFIFTDIIDINNEKNSERKKRELRLNKKLIIETFEIINNKEFPNIVFSNIIGILIKVSVIMVILNNNKRPSKDQQHNIIRMIVKEVINVIPDDRCYLKDKKMDFVKFSPKLCIYNELSIPKQRLNNCYSKLDKAEKLAFWKYIGIGFIILSIILFIMYLVKKPVRYIRSQE